MFTKAKITILSALFIVFPLFFLTITQEFFMLNKFILLYVITFTLTLIALLRLITTRKISLIYSKIDTSVLLLIVVVTTSTIVSSPNKIAALFSIPFGLFPMITLATLYCIIKNTPRSDWTVFKPGELLSIGAIAAGVVAIAFYANPFGSPTLAPSIAFLKTPLFNTVGSVIDTTLFFGFFVAMAIANIINRHKKNAPILIAGGLGTIIVLSNIFYIVKTNQLRLPPVSQSWLAAVETLKHPQTALFGVGIDNFAGQFTLVKNTAYNSSNLWNVNFALSRSTLLHVWTETGLLGLAGILLLVIITGRTVFRLLSSGDSHAKAFSITGIYLLFTFVFFPPSFPLFFLLCAYLGTLASRGKHRELHFDFHKMLFPYIVIIFVCALILPMSAYAVARMYSSEIYFKKSLNALNTGDVAPIYQYLQKAIIINPYEEKYRLTFSQLNLLIANNIAVSKAQNLSEQDRQNITQTIQDAIREAKAAVALNPDHAANWENLAVIYQNLLNVAQGADAWAISAYQKAILLDPVNPQLRLSLGGVYFSLKQFPNAATFFAQAVSLKPDWANARYNLAWAFFQNKEYDKAILVMKNVLTLVEKGSGDFVKVEGDIQVFEEAKAASSQAQVAPVESAPVASSSAALALPEKPQAVVSPKIALPTETVPSN